MATFLTRFIEILWKARLGYIRLKIMNTPKIWHHISLIYQKRILPLFLGRKVVPVVRSLIFIATSKIYHFYQFSFLFSLWLNHRLFNGWKLKMTLCFGNCLVFECLAILLCLCSIVPTVENYDYVSDKLAPIILGKMP